MLFELKPLFGFTPLDFAHQWRSVPRVLNVNSVYVDPEQIKDEKWHDIVKDKVLDKESALGSMYSDISDEMSAERLSNTSLPGTLNEASVDNLVYLEEAENAGIKLEASRRVAEAAAKIAEQEANKIKHFGSRVQAVL